MSTTSCEGCAGCRGEPTDKADVAPDLPPDAPGIDMQAARDNAEKRATGLAVELTDEARFLASEIEAETTEVDPVAPSDPAGQIDSDALQKVFANHQSELQQCYERALKRSPDLAGRIILQVDIAPDGSVSRVVASGDTLQSDTVNKCMEQRARDWTFPEPRGGTARVRKPFSFSPKQ